MRRVFRSIRIERGDLSPLSSINPVNRAAKSLDSTGSFSGISLARVKADCHFYLPLPKTKPYEFVRKDGRC
jgi:hypothetical protein